MAALRGHAAPSPGAPNRAASEINALADEYISTVLATRPELGTQYGIKGAHHSGITDNSLEGVRRRQKQLDSLYQRLLAVDSGAVRGRAESITYGVLRESLEEERQKRVCHFELWSGFSSERSGSGLPVTRP
jgi:uncharacterized protein (DUF885 family)